MTARQLQLQCRDVAIWCARKGGMRIDMIALAHDLSTRRVRSVLRELGAPKAQNAALEKILDCLENKGSANTRAYKRFTPRTAPL
jgi:hypothetical protein